MAIVSSLLSFNREQQKEYLIPIVIKDTGAQPMSGTSTLTVIIGDINDNKMQPGSKDIFVYNYAVRIIFFSLDLRSNNFIVELQSFDSNLILLPKSYQTVQLITNILLEYLITRPYNSRIQNYEKYLYI